MSVFSNRFEETGRNVSELAATAVTATVDLAELGVEATETRTAPAPERSGFERG